MLFLPFHRDGKSDPLLIMSWRLRAQYTHFYVNSWTMKFMKCPPPKKKPFSIKARTSMHSHVVQICHYQEERPKSIRWVCHNIEGKFLHKSWIVLMYIQLPINLVIHKTENLGVISGTLQNRKVLYLLQKVTVSI